VLNAVASITPRTHLLPLDTPLSLRAHHTLVFSSCPPFFVPPSPPKALDQQSRCVNALNVPTKSLGLPLYYSKQESPELKIAKGSLLITCKRLSTQASTERASARKSSLSSRAALPSRAPIATLQHTMYLSFCCLCLRASPTAVLAGRKRPNCFEHACSGPRILSRRGEREARWEGGRGRQSAWPDGNIPASRLFWESAPDSSHCQVVGCPCAHSLCSLSHKEDQHAN
jgi:hypothetical protein